MKVLMFNGSPRRHGNTANALAALGKGLAKHHTVETVEAAPLRLSGCINCDSCQSNGGDCVLPDGTARLMKKVEEADLIVFASPVYWWGITGQLKLVLDKFYSKGAVFAKMKKKLGIIAIGAAELSDPEYKLISGQFKCIADYLGWELVIDESIAAGGVDDLAGNPEKLAQLESLGEKL